MTSRDRHAGSDNLGQRSLRAVVWSGADILFTHGLRFAVTVVLARLLAPEDFGAVAVLYLFLGLGSMFVDCGFGAALIQRQEVTRIDESTVFFFNLAVAAAAALLLAALSGQIANFFSLPILQPLACLMALNLFIGAFGSIHGTLLTKALDFRTQMKVNIIASVTSGTAAIILASRGFGVWSLALQMTVATTVSVILLWSWHQWRPNARFSFTSLRSLFSFGSYMLLSGLLDTIGSRIHTVFIGRIYSPRALAFFSRAENTQQLPATLLSAILSRVAFPVYSAAANDSARLARGVRRSLTTIMMINIPAMSGIALVADPLVRTVFGEKWAPSIPLLRILCFSGMLWPLHVINLNVLMAQGRSDLFFRLEVLKTVLGIGALLVASLYSVTAIAVSWVVVGIMSFLINGHYTGVFLGYGAVRQIGDILPYGAVTILMVMGAWPISLCVSLKPPVMLVLQTAVGVLIYFAACKFLRLAAFRDAWQVAMQELERIGRRTAPTS